MVEEGRLSDFSHHLGVNISTLKRTSVNKITVNFSQIWKVLIGCQLCALRATGGCGKLTALGVDTALAVWNWACNWEEKCYWLYFIIDCNKARLALCYSDFRVTGPHTAR